MKPGCKPRMTRMATYRKKHTLLPLIYSCLFVFIRGRSTSKPRMTRMATHGKKHTLLPLIYSCSFVFIRGCSTSKPRMTRMATHGKKHTPLPLIYSWSFVVAQKFGFSEKPRNGFPLSAERRLRGRIPKQIRMVMYPHGGRLSYSCAALKASSLNSRSFSQRIPNFSSSISSSLIFPTVSSSIP